MGRVAAQMEKRGIPVTLEIWDHEDIRGIGKKACKEEGVPEIRQVATTPDTTVTSLNEFIPEFIDALTRPLTEKEKWSGHHKPEPPPRIAMTGNYDEIQAYFEGDLTRFPARKAPVALMTDGLPVTPPTEERVAAMLKGTSHAPDETIEIISSGPPGVDQAVAGIATVEKVAVNGVMAGCKPEHMPVLLAMAELGVCLGGPSDSSMGHMYVVSGPIAREIGMNSGISHLCPGNPANMSIGRACVLMGINLGQCIIGASSIGRMGNNIWGLTFAESELSPWEGLNTDEGYGPNENVLLGWNGFPQLTLPGALNVKTPTNLLDYQNASPEHLVTALKTCTENLGSLVLFTPDTANEWRERYGFKSIQQLQDYLYDNVTQSRSEMESHYRFYAIKEELMGNPRGSRLLNPDHLDLPEDAPVPRIIRGPNSIKIIVAGGPGYAWGWGVAWKPRSISIDKWR